MAKKYKINTRTGKFDLVGNGGGGGGDYSLRSPQQTIKVTETTSGHNIDVADELQTKIENAYQSSIGRRIHCGTGGKFEMFRISYANTNSGRECSFQIVVRKLYTIVAVVEYTLIVGKTNQDGHNGDYIDFNYTVKYVKSNYNVENLICCERIQNHTSSQNGVVVVFVNAADSNLMICYSMGARYSEVGEVPVASGTINYDNSGQPFTSSEDYVTATIFEQSSESEEAKINYYRVPVSFGTPQESIKIVGNTDSDSVDDGYILNSGQLMQIGDYYYLFYMGLASGETSETQYHILSAYSADGLTWQRGFPDGITPPVAGTNRLLSESGLIEHCIVEVPDSEYPYRLLCNKIASSSSQSMRLYKSSDGINYVFVGTILNEKHDSQMSAICKGDTIEVYTRIWDDAHTNRQVGSLTIDLNGNIVKSLHVVLGDNLYNSAAIAIDPHRELLFPTWYIGVNASTQQNAHLECYQMQGEKAIKLNTNISQILADDEYWALVCPGIIAINGQKYIAVNAWKRHHYTVAGDVNKMETRLVPISIDLTSTSAESSYYDDTVTQYGSDNVQGALEAIGANLGELDGRVTDLEQGGGGGSVDVGNCITINTTLPTLEANKTYEIKGDVVLTSNISIPNGVTFFFNGGSLNGSGTIALGDSVVTFCGDVKIASSVQFTGTLANDEVVLEWFQGLVLDPTTTHTINATLIERAISIVKPHYIVRFNDLYPISRAIEVSKSVRLMGFEHQDVYAERIWQATCGIYTTQFTNGINVNSGGKLSIYNLQIIGWPELGYSNNNLFNYPQTKTFSNTLRGKTYSVTVSMTGNGANTRGINCVANNKDREIYWVEHSGVCGFTSGIRSYGSYLKQISDSQIVSCRWGLWCQYTSDFVLSNVHFNTCHNNYNFRTSTVDGSSTAADIRTNALSCANATSAIYLDGCGMVQCNDCRFEFNAMSIALCNYGHGIQFNDCIFDHNANMFVSAYANGRVYTDEEPNFSDISFDGCRFMRGCQIGESGDTESGWCYFNFKHTSGGATTTNPQKMIFDIIGCAFSDRCYLPNLIINNHEKYAFYFNCDSVTDAVKINLTGSNFEDTRAGAFADWSNQSMGRVQIWASGVVLPNGAAPGESASFSMPEENDPIKYIEDGCIYVSELPSDQINNVKYFIAQS